MTEPRGWIYTTSRDMTRAASFHLRAARVVVRVVMLATPVAEPTL
jgi:hypothetical protein